MHNKVKKFSEFGKRLAKLAESHGLNIGQLANKIDVSRNTISAYMAGAQLPSGENLLSLARSLGTSPNYLLLGSDLNDTENAAPPMLDGSPQGWVSVGPKMLDSMGVDPVNLRVFVHREEDAFSPEFGVKTGDLVFVDISVQKATRFGLYLVRSGPSGPLRVRLLYDSPEGTLEVDNGFLRDKDAVTLETLEVVAKVVGRAGTTV
jgi:plasmid maintenance system antidote protein VapI